MDPITPPQGHSERLLRTAQTREALIVTVEKQVEDGTLVRTEDGDALLLPIALTDDSTLNDIAIHPESTIMLQVLVVSGSDGDLVASQTDLLEQLRRRAEDDALEGMAKGQVVEAHITGLEDFGAVCLVGLVPGMIHISDLSWFHVDSPADVVKVGDRVSVVILDVDRNRRRISVGLKQATPDPWATFTSTHRAGDVIEGRVVRDVGCGLFIALGGGIEGLLAFNTAAPDDPRLRDGWQEGSVLEVRLAEVDPDRRRIALRLP